MVDLEFCNRHSDSKRVWFRGATVLTAWLLLSGCQTEGVYEEVSENSGFVRADEAIGESVFVSKETASPARYADSETVERFSEEVRATYQFGPGDEFAFLVAHRPEISRETNVIAPDGLVALPRAGVVRLAGLTLPEATRLLEEKLSPYYTDPKVTLSLTRIHNNRVFVLGRVANPGAVNFTGSGTLLEALSLAGGLPADTQKSFLSRCMIVRGSDTVIWIDLRDLLENGNMTLNARLKNGDFIFIPQSEDQIAYVLGQVRSPGVLVLRSQMTLMDAIMNAGGPTLGADSSKILLVRMIEGKGYIAEIDFREMFRKGDLRENYVLRAGDIVYVGETPLQSVNNVITQLLPSMGVIDFSFNSLESLGVMQEIREGLWGQQGTVGRGSSNVE